MSVSIAKPISAKYLEQPFLSSIDPFIKRHIGVSDQELAEMLSELGVGSLEELIGEVVPKEVLLQEELKIQKGKDEFSYLKEIREKISKNQKYKNYIGLGYHPVITPSVLQRNIFENPAWYTPYTPYQSEISQGRLEGFINFQTMVSDLTSLPMSNASLLDEATAAAEAMMMVFRARPTTKKKADQFFVSKNCFPQTIDVLRSRAEPLDIQIVEDDEDDFDFSNSFFGMILQCPDQEGFLRDHSLFIQKAFENDIKAVVACDLLSLALVKPPGEMGVDIAVGNSQRFGVPMGFGGPHAAFLACREEYKRLIPGRMIGISKTSHDEVAYRMALQTREQHIRREKATSNICTAQALPANMAGMYAVYHGKEGIERIAKNIHSLALILKQNLESLEYKIKHQAFFDTFFIRVPDEVLLSGIRALARSKKINFRYDRPHSVGISLHERASLIDIEEIIQIFAEAKKRKYFFQDNIASSGTKDEEYSGIPKELLRTSDYLESDVFKNFHSETKMMRYLYSLEKKDISLCNSMIPLGSCTMKLNSAVQMVPLSWSEVSEIHPFIPEEQAKGYQEIIQELEDFLKEITGLDAVSFQPNSGAQGEYTGLMVIRAFHKDQNSKRDIVLIPSSAHGTNPASAVMAGMKIVEVSCDAQGNIDLNDLKEKVDRHHNSLASLMLTYPSTHGIFEEGVKEACGMIHRAGGLVYMDGANMNAQVGISKPAFIGADVCHLNLHKTFAIPHGGGGPGMGPIAVTAKLAPYLPKHFFDMKKKSSSVSIHAVASAPYSSASILLVSHAYISLLGGLGLKMSSMFAILNANYIKQKLEKYFRVLFTNKNDRVAHELIIDLKDFKKLYGIEPEDIAKRLIDYGYHSPTMSWPVPGSMMIEPTESESKEELDRFCEAMISIWKEIQKIKTGDFSREDNPLKNAPHTHQAVVNKEWDHLYSREEAVYPLPYLRENKFWPPVSRIDHAYGDRFLVCTKCN